MSEGPLFVASEPEASNPEADREERRITLIQHLEELRKVLIVSLVSWVIGSVIGLLASSVVIDLLVRPLQYLHKPLYYFGPMGFFTIHLKVGLVVGFVIALPLVLYQVWSFVAPGLKPKERRFAALAGERDRAVCGGGGLAYFFLLYCCAHHRRRQQRQLEPGLLPRSRRLHRLCRAPDARLRPHLRVPGGAGARVPGRGRQVRAGCAPIALTRSSRSAPSAMS